MDCINASIPEETVTDRGQLTVIRGSRKATFGKYIDVLIPSRRFSSLSVKTAFAVTSEPVPAVVGTAINGIPAFLIKSKPRYCLAGAGLVTRTDKAFAKSIVLPPPKQMRQSTFALERSPRHCSR